MKKSKIRLPISNKVIPNVLLFEVPETDITNSSMHMHMH